MLSVKFGERLTGGTFTELQVLVDEFNALWLEEHNEDGTHIVAAGTTLDQTLPYVTVGNVSSLTNERALVGTTNEVDVTDNGAGSTVAIGLPAAVTITTSLSVPTVTISGLTSTRIPIAGVGGLIGDDADLTFVTDTLTATKVAAPTHMTTPVQYLGTSAGSGTATTTTRIVKKVTGIADNTATAVVTVTVPNANHAAAIKLTFVSSNGSTDAFESSRVATGHVVLARTTGANVVATAVTIDDAAIATVSGGATHTLAYDLSAITGGVGDSNTFTIRVTIDDSGNLGSSQVVVLAELINAEATGVTIA